MKPIFAVAGCVALLCCATEPLACGSATKDAWRESGQSWKESGRQFRRALGRSIAGDESPKQEWKQLGSDLGEAGKDTGRALQKTVEPPPAGTSSPKR